MNDTGDRRTNPIHGWRLWTLDRSRNSEGWVLKSPFSSMEWRPRVPVVASCRKPEPLAGLPQGMLRELGLGKHDDDATPDLRCHCGIYAYSAGPFFEDFLVARSIRSRPSLLWLPLMPPSILGQVAGWGRVIEHTKGWRAAFAYPSSLALMCALCLNLQTRLTPATCVVSYKLRRLPLSLVAICDTCRAEHGGCDGLRRARTITMAATAEAELCARYGVVRANPPVSVGNMPSAVLPLTRAELAEQQIREMIEGCTDRSSVTLRRIRTRETRAIWWPAIKSALLYLGTFGMKR
jgi:hypothetical protein